MNRRIIWTLALFGALSFIGAANAACPTVTYHTLTNGTVANANDVMDNFTYTLGCPKINEALGIGKNPTYVLDVDAKTYNSGTIAQFDSSYATGGGIRLASSGVTELWFGTGTFAAPGLGVTDIGMVARGALLFDTGAGHSRPALYITSSGNVSLGAMSAAALLDLAGNVTAVNSTANAIRFTDLSGVSNSRNWLVGNGAGPNYGDLTFLVSTASGGSPTGTPVLNLSRSGNVGINTASPAQALEVNGQIKVNTLASASSTSLCINANVIASCSSSLRYKENIQDADFGLKDVLAMRPVRFKWKQREENDFGLIAEEVAKIDPAFVTRMNGKIEGIKYPQLTAVLIGAVKEMSKRNEQLEEEVRALRRIVHKQANDRRLRDVDLRLMDDRLRALEKPRLLQSARN